MRLAWPVGHPWVKVSLCNHRLLPNLILVIVLHRSLVTPHPTSKHEPDADAILPHAARSKAHHVATHGSASR